MIPSSGGGPTSVRARPAELGDRDLTSDRPIVVLAVGVSTIVAIGAVSLSHRQQPLTALLLSSVVICYGLLSASDLAQQRLPNRMTVPLAVATGLTVLAAGVVRADVAAAFGALAVGLIFAVIFAALRFGMGDVKLALTVGTIAGWFGRDAVMATAYVGAVAGAVVALILIIIHRRRDVSFGFGPLLAIGSVAGMLVAGG